MFIFTIRDILLTLIIIAVILWFLFVAANEYLCKHKDTWVSGLSHDEICRKCGKNLGFVGRAK